MSKQRISILVLTLIGSILGVSSLFPLNAQDSSLLLPGSASRGVYQLIQNGGFESAGNNATGAQAWEGKKLRPADKRLCTAEASSHGNCGFRFSNIHPMTIKRSIVQTYDPSNPFGSANDQVLFSYMIKIPTLTAASSFRVTAQLDYINPNLAPDIFIREYTSPMVSDSFVAVEDVLTLKGRADKLTVTFRMTIGNVGSVFVDRVRATLLTDLPTVTPTMSLTPSRTPTATNTPSTPCLTSNTGSNSPRTTQCPPTKTYTPTNTDTPTNTPTDTLTPTNTPTNTNTPANR